MKRSTLIFTLGALIKPSQACLEHLAPRAPAAVPTNCPGNYVPPETTTAIVNAQVFDGEGFGDPQTVVFSKGKIGTIGGDPPENVTIVDGTGKFLIPGLMDGHVRPADCTALAELARYGVTTAVNMNCEDYDACAGMRAQSGVADYVTASLFAVGQNSSHAMLFKVPGDETIKPDTDLAAKVEDAFSNGSDFFKIVAEENGPSQEQQKEIVQLVRGYGKFTATHATTLEFYDQAIESSTETIQHTPSDELLSGDQVAQIKSQGQFVTPTMEFFRFAFGNETLKELLGLGDAEYTTIEKNVGLLHDAGVPMAAGTDAVGNLTGIISYSYGDTLHCELQNLAQAGFGNAGAIRAATSEAAQLYKLNDRGSINEELRADLVLLNIDPTDDIANSLDVQNVWVGEVSVKDILVNKNVSCT